MSAGASAQPPAREVIGTVARAIADGEQRPVPGVWVTLHRVNRDSGAALDSVRSAANGAYRFRFDPVDDPEALYFATAEWSGIAYFAGPFRESRTVGDAALLLVFDTTSTGPLTVAARHVVVSSPGADGARGVVEILELANETSKTIVAPHIGATFTAVLPVTARDPRPGPGDIAASAMAIGGGLVKVIAPISPGIRQLAFSYEIGAADFPLKLFLRDSTPVLEVLVEDSAGTATGAGLVEADPVTIDGRWFRRFLARDPARGAAVSISVPPPMRGSRRIYIAAIVVIVGAAMLVALARAGFRRTSNIVR